MEKFMFKYLIISSLCVFTFFKTHSVETRNSVRLSDKVLSNSATPPGNRFIKSGMGLEMGWRK